MAFSRTNQGVAEYVASGNTTAFESYKAVVAWLAIPGLLGLGAEYLWLGFGVLLIVLMIPWSLFMPIISGYWSINQIMVVATKPGSPMWGMINPSLHNEVGMSLLGFVLLPLLLLVIYPIYLIRSIAHIIKIASLRSKNDKRGAYFEFGRRRFWFRQLREAKRRNMQGETFKQFILATSMGVFLRKDDMSDYYDENAKVFREKAFQAFYREMVSAYGTPEL